MARGAVGRMDLFKRYDSEHFVERSQSLEHAIERVLLHEFHAVVSREAADFVIAAAGANGAADGIVEHQHFVNSDAPSVAGKVAGIAAVGKILRARWLLNPSLNKSRGIFRAHRCFHVTCAEAANQTLRDDAAH